MARTYSKPGPKRSGMTKEERRVLPAVIETCCLYPNEARLLRHYLNGPRTCAQYDHMSPEIQDAINMVTRG